MQRYLTCLFLLASFSIPAFPQASEAVPQWEYKFAMDCEGSNEEFDVEKLGEEGWELVSTDRRISGGDSNRCITYYFKRPRKTSSGQRQPESFNLPEPRAWDPPKGKYQKTVECKDFEARAYNQSYSTTIGIGTKIYYQQVQQRISDDSEKRRKAFKP